MQEETNLKETSPRPFAIDLSPAAVEVLHGLFIEGPLYDGDVPSKSGRDELVGFGLVARHNGWQQLTRKGLEMALSAKLDQKKNKYYRDRTKALRLLRVVSDFWNPPEELTVAWKAVSKDASPVSNGEDKDAARKAA